MKVESFGWLFCFLSGEVRTGIQQESEWPYSSHSRVHFPVRATSGRGRESENERELSLQINITMDSAETSLQTQKVFLKILVGMWQ